MDRMSRIFTLFFIFSSPLIFNVAAQSLKLDKADKADDQRQNYPHGICIAVFKLLKGRFIQIVHDRCGSVVGAAGCQQLNQ